MESISEKISKHTFDLINILALLKERLDDDNIDSEKEMKCLHHMILSYYKIREKVDKVLTKEPKYYVNSDDDTESDCEVTEDMENAFKFKERLQKIIRDGTNEIKNLEHFNGMVCVEKAYIY
jgi:hypothetical protein